MNKEDFFDRLSAEACRFKQELTDSEEDWIVKGFIDVCKNVYTISADTKVVSKIIEILLIPKLQKFAEKCQLEIIMPSKQNFYPDITFRDNDGNMFAVDFKTSYYDGEIVNGLTLGSYWGYFRNRDNVRNMDFPYNAYCSHIVLGVLYKRNIGTAGYDVYGIDDLGSIRSVIRDFVLFVQPKWKIASDKPGSGNTRNIGGITDVAKLCCGEGSFSQLGEDVFDDYWTGYFNIADAKAVGLGVPPYRNLDEYEKYLQSKADKLSKLQNS